MTLKFLFFLFTVTISWISLQAKSLSAIELEDAMSRMGQELVQVQSTDGRFEGTFEADPGLELLTLVLLKKFGQRDLEVEMAFIAKAMNWKNQEGFGTYPGGPYSHDVTGMVLISLQELGFELTQWGLGKVQERFLENGGVQTLNIATKLLLAPLDLADSKLLQRVLTPTFLRVPSGILMSQKKLGIFRSLMIPFATWNYYHQKNNKRSRLLRLLTPGDKKRALEGVKWILDHQMPDGSWYTMMHTLLHVSALSEAQTAGVGNFEREIRLGLEAVKSWRTFNYQGEITQQLTLTTGWDTPQTLMALAELPSALRAKHLSAANSAVQFLDRHQITEKGDWAVKSQELVPGGWSFIVQNRDYPDTDVVAAVLEAKLAFPAASSAETFERGLNWLLGLQNKDGGFPAWEKGVSRASYKLIKKIMPELPEYSDLSQADVTSRIARLLFKLANHPEISQEKRNEVQKSLAKSCRFIWKDKEAHPFPIWKGRWLVSYLYGTSEAMDALLSTGCGQVQALAQSMEWIVSKQNADGGFGEDHLSFLEEKFVGMDSTVMQTSYVVQGMMAFEEKFKLEHGSFSPYKEQLDRAMDFLLQRAKQDQWLMKERSFTGVIAAKLWYSDYALSPQFMTLRALGRYYRLISNF